MLTFNISNLYFNPEDVLSFWQYENVQLNEQQCEELLGSREIQELVKNTKSAVLHGFCVNQRIYSSNFVKEQKKIFSMDSRIWITSTQAFVLHHGWKYEPIYRREMELLEQWQARYGKLSGELRASFRSNPEVAEIVEYQLSDVLLELSKNKKVKDILKCLRESGCQKKPELDERLQGAIEVNLKDEAIRTEKLFKSINESFKNEIEQKNKDGRGPYMDLTSVRSSPPHSWGGREVCNSCGAIIGLINDHSC